MNRILVIIFSVLLLYLPDLKANDKYNGKVMDSKSYEPIAGAVVKLSGTGVWTVSKSDGVFELPKSKTTSDSVMLEISCLGYKKSKFKLRKDGIYVLTPKAFAINEVVVTATESKGLTSVSRIGEDAISHIQPSGFADLLELLPGGRSIDPNFGRPQTINLRSAGGYSSTSALGTKFILDGASIENDANMQYTPSYSMMGSTYVNNGMDMRTLTTEDIEYVDVIRGIPSVTYGDLTSGVINIKRRSGGNDLRARFKADMTSKLLYMAKDFETKSKNKFTSNLSLNIFDSRVDPRNLRQNYKRATGSLRIGKTWFDDSRQYIYRLNWNTDYTGSFDDQKDDRDIDRGYKRAVETYKSSYNRFMTALDFSINSKKPGRFFRTFNFKSSFSYAKDIIDRWRFIAGGSEPLSASKEAGEFDAIIPPSQYDATLVVEGLPFYGNIVASSSFMKKTGAFEHRFNVGAEWKMAKNYGRGSIFDVMRPFSPRTIKDIRPRVYRDIPALQQVATYLEYRQKVTFWGFCTEAAFGVRGGMMGNIGKGYFLQWKPYVEPRVNVRVDMPAITIYGKKAEFGIYGGFGLHRKFPTMQQLHPDVLYEDLPQFNYWSNNEAFRRVNMLVCKINPANKGLYAATNIKWETGGDIHWNGYSFALDYFKEDMTSGFRNATSYYRVVFKDYDESKVDSDELTGPPDLGDIPYQLDTAILGYSFLNNGSRNTKEGVELTFSTKRIKPLATRLTINGAWFRTRYSNSIPEYYWPNVNLKGKRYPYIGLYDITEKTEYEYFNTNFMFDTYIQKLGLIFSTSFQCLWYTSRNNLPLNPIPISYIDKNLKSHPFTEESAKNGIYAIMIRDFAQGKFFKEKIPFSMNVNLKVTKKLYDDKITCSLFVNKIFSVNKDFYLWKRLQRRSVLPYFGMELSFKF